MGSLERQRDRAQSTLAHMHAHGAVRTRDYVHGVAGANHARARGPGDVADDTVGLGRKRTADNRYARLDDAGLLPRDGGQ